MERLEGIVQEASWIGVAAAAVVLLATALLLWRISGGGGSAEARIRKKGMAPVPPGTSGWPLFGETMEFLRYTRENHIEDFFANRVAKYGKVFRTNLMFNTTVSLPAPEGNKFLFANENKLVQNAWPPSVASLLGNSLVTQVGDEHKRARRIFTSFFGPEALQSFVPRMDALARSNLESLWEGKDQIVGVPVLKEYTFAIVADLFLSLKQGDPLFRELEVAVEDFLGGIMQLPIDLPGTVYHKARLGRESILRSVDVILRQRRQDLKDGKVSGTQDMLSVLLTTPNEDGILMSEDDIKDNIVLMVFAGHDTSSITMALVLKYLFLNPECLEQVVQEQKAIAEEKAGAPLAWADTRKMKYTWRVCQETLRLQPPAVGAFRKAIQDFEYEGHTILKGWMLVWNVGRSHYSPEYFPDPTKFDPTRFEGSGPAPYTFVPFGGGPHICVGNEFARTEMMVYLHNLVLNFDWEMVDPEENVAIMPMPTFAKKLQLKVHKKPAL